jgi:hypothetical protein
MFTCTEETFLRPAISSPASGGSFQKVAAESYAMKPTRDEIRKSQQI